MSKNYTVTPVTYYKVRSKGTTSHYTKYEEMQYDFAKVMKNGRWSVLDPNGNEVCPMQYVYVVDMAAGYCRLYKEDGTYDIYMYKTGELKTSSGDDKK